MSTCRNLEENQVAQPEIKIDTGKSQRKSSHSTQNQALSNEEQCEQKTCYRALGKDLREPVLKCLEQNEIRARVQTGDRDGQVGNQPDEVPGARLTAGKERWPLHSMEAELTIEKFLVEKSKLGLSAAK
jgi:hypothetical protein